MNESIEIFYNKTYTLYRCTPFANFPYEDRGFRNLERRIAEILCEQLDYYLEGQTPDLDSTEIKGKISLLRFRPFDLEGFEYDTSGNENPPLLFELEFETLKGKKHQQSLIILPAVKLPENYAESLWYYPLALSKLSVRVFTLVSHILDKDFDCRMELLNIPHRVFESHIKSVVDAVNQARLRDFEYIANNIETSQFSSLKLEYSTSKSDLKTIRFTIEPDQLLRICTFVGSSDKFYSSFCQHILNTSKINLNALQINSVSSHVVSLSVSSKLKFNGNALEAQVIDLLYELIELAAKGRGITIWV